MNLATRVAIGGVLAATMLPPSVANAGHGHSHGHSHGHHHYHYRAPVVVRPVFVSPRGGGQGGGQGVQGQGVQGQGGQGQNGQNQNGQVTQNQNGQTQNGQNQNGQVAQNQNGQNQNNQNQNQNGQNQNGQNNTAAVQVPSGSQITLSGDFTAQGQVYLNINNVKIPLTVDEWTTTGITLTLPAVQLTQPQSVTIDVVTQAKTDSIAITLNPKARVVVNTQPQQPGGQGGSGTVAASEVAGAQ